MVDITAQFNWWRRWQPQAGWWGAEGSHTYGPLCLWGSLYVSWSSMGADDEMERMMAGMRTSDWQMRQTDTHKEQTRPQKMNVTAQIRKCENLQR